MKVIYIFRYLTDVALFRHGLLTPRQVMGDVHSIWSAEP